MRGWRRICEIESTCAPLASMQETCARIREVLALGSPVRACTSAHKGKGVHKGKGLGPSGLFTCQSIACVAPVAV